MSEKPTLAECVERARMALNDCDDLDADERAVITRLVEVCERVQTVKTWDGGITEYGKGWDNAILAIRGER